MLATIHDVIVARSAEVVATLAADEKRDGAAVHALVVDELVAVQLAEVRAEALVKLLLFLTLLTD